jgi:serine protease Do
VYSAKTWLDRVGRTQAAPSFVRNSVLFRNSSVFLRRLTVALAGIFCFLIFPGGLFAQKTLPASLENSKTLTPERQAELRRELERHISVLEAQSAVLRTVAKLVGPAVVFIEADRGTDPTRKHTIQEDGSGVIIKWKDKYYVLTNRHVVRDTPLSGVKIDLADGRRILPDKILQDVDSDIAVLAISAPNLVAAPLGDSDKMDVGDFVLAMGSPFGLSQSFTAGIISGKGRRNLRFGNKISPHDFLQTDAAINPGNSGGPLVNQRGEVIGINTAIASNSGVNEGFGFAIPSNIYMFFARQLIDNGKVARAFLGVNLESKFGQNAAVELGLPRLMGAKISAITPQSPADSAKLQPGDVILEFNNVPIQDDGHLVNVVGTSEVGSKATILVYRNRETFTAQIELQERSKYQQ